MAFKLKTFIQKIIYQFRLDLFAEQISQSRYTKAKLFRIRKIILKNFFKDFLLITAGIFAAGFGLKGFLLANQFIDGGVTGISLLITSLSGVPLWQIILLVNIPFIFLGYQIMGLPFAAKSTMAITGLSLCLALVNFPMVTNEKVLIAVFGGIFLGAGIGLAIRGGSVIDGTEVLAIYLSRKASITIGDIVLAINCIIFSLAAYLLSVETALYSIITYMVASRMLDFVVEGIEEYIGVTIITSHRQEMLEMITRIMGRGVTVYEGKSGYGKRGGTREVEIIYTVITRLEIGKLKTEIEKIAPEAFVVMTPVKEIKGGLIKKRPFTL